MKFFALWLLTITLSSAQLTVSSLNPILTDFIERVGGDKVEVIQVMPLGADVHSFQPKAAQVAKMQESALIFAMGKNIEQYLGGLKQTLQGDQQIIEVGRSIPSQKVDADPIYSCCPAHSKGAIDPHWWHNVENAERAVKVIAAALEEADSTNKGYYQDNATALRKEYRNLHNWVKSEVSKIPKKQRTLVTAHAAFAYFCKEYKFEAAYVEGLSRESEISAKQFANTVKTLKDKKVRAVFPEKLANPKMLKQIALETNAKVGDALYADAITTSYKKMIEHNVTSIVNALQ